MNEHLNQEFTPQYKHEAYTTDRRFWGEWMQHASVALARSIVTISSGAIGLSVVLLSQLVKPDTIPHWTLVILIASWISLLAAMISVLISYQLSRKGIEAIIDELDFTYDLNEEKVRNARSTYQSADSKSRLWDKTAFVTFVLGIVLMLVFVIIGIVADIA